MTTEWIDVVDTAVKIGLGALITGCFTHLGVKTSRKSEKQKFMLEHRTKLLEQISNDVDIYLRSLENFFGLVIGVALYQKRDGIEGEPFDAEDIEQIKKHDKELINVWANHESAISKMRLLKAHDIADECNKLTTLEKNLRNKIFFHDAVPTYNELKRLSKELMTTKKKIHNSLADLYENLQN